MEKEKGGDRMESLKGEWNHKPEGLSVLLILQLLWLLLQMF